MFDIMEIASILSFILNKDLTVEVRTEQSSSDEAS